MNFNGQVKILAGTFKTWYELIIAAVNARTYASATEKARVVSMWRQAAGTSMRFKPSANIYTLDAWKGNANGVITQSAWAAGDFTASPGGGRQFDGGIEYGPYRDVPLTNQVVYAAADTTIDLDVTAGGPFPN